MGEVVPPELGEERSWISLSGLSLLSWKYMRDTVPGGEGEGLILDLNSLDIIPTGSDYFFLSALGTEYRDVRWTAMSRGDVRTRPFVRQHTPYGGI
jgi:hypothetical protein